MSFDECTVFLNYGDKRDRMGLKGQKEHKGLNILTIGMTKITLFLRNGDKRDKIAKNIILFNSFVPFVPSPHIGDKRMYFSAIAEFFKKMVGDRTILWGQKNWYF